MINTTEISRREFIARLGLLGSLALTYPAAALAELRQSSKDKTLPDWIDEPVWKTRAQLVSDRAVEISVFLESLLQDETIEHGVKTLKVFYELSDV